MPNILSQEIQALARNSVDALVPLIMSRVYESGAWTPALEGSTTAGTLAYDVAQTVGRFVRVGGKVTATARIVLTAVTAAPTGDLRVTGLPYTVGVGGLRGGAVASYENLDLDAAWRAVGATPSPGAAYAVLFATVDNGARTAALGAALTATTVIDVWLEYEAVDRIGLRETILALGPIAYWPLDETTGTTAVDATGSGRDGTYTGPSLGGDFPPFTAPTFDGVSDYIDIYSASLAGAFDGDEGALLAFVAGPPTVAASVTAVALGTTSERVRLARSISGSALFGSRSDGNGNVSPGDTTNRGTGWHMLAATWSVAANIVRVYVDGAQVASGSGFGLIPFTSPLDSNSARIGVISSAGSDFWSGQIAHVAIFASVLGAGDIADVWDAYQAEL